MADVKDEREQIDSLLTSVYSVTWQVTVCSSLLASPEPCLQLRDVRSQNASRSTIELHPVQGWWDSNPQLASPTAGSGAIAQGRRQESNLTVAAGTAPPEFSMQLI